jgi:hypothetical protein
MPIIASFPFLAANLIFMAILIRWRGLLSFEGLGLGLLFVTMVMDWLSLGSAYIFSPHEVGPLLMERIYPLSVHLVGIGALGAGLWIADPSPRPLSFQGESGMGRIRSMAWTLVVIGLGMKFFALWSSGLLNPNLYYEKMFSYVSSQRKWGGFWDEGLNVAVLGFGLLVAETDRLRKQILLFVLMMGFTLLLSFSRGGVVAPVFYFFIFLWAFNKRSFARWTHPLFLTALLVGVVVSAGIKSQTRWESSKRDFSASSIVRVGLGRFSDRFGQAGLFDGYVNIVHRLSFEGGQRKGGDVLLYTLTSWVPFVFYHDKPVNPFRAIGDLVYRDYRIDENDVSAPTLVGSAFLDFGVASVVVYLLVYGWVLGFLKRSVLSVSGTYAFVWYILVTFVDGFTNFIHGGIVNLPYTLGLGSGITLFLFLVMTFGKRGRELFFHRAPSSNHFLKS